MKPQANMKVIAVCMSPIYSLRYSLLVLLLPMQLQAASISEELLKTTPTVTRHDIKINTVQSVKLSVSPKQCVAMQKGQRCYLQVNLAFQANTVDDYCLYLSTQQAALQCWQKAKQGQLSYAFDSKVDMEFVVKAPLAGKQVEQLKEDLKPLAKAKVKMAWVHEKKGKPRMSWRLF